VSWETVAAVAIVAFHVLAWRYWQLDRDADKLRARLDAALRLAADGQAIERVKREGGE
jgi:hypothetical protein